MPVFQTQDLDINAEEFLDACSYREIKKLIELLRRDGHLNGNSLAATEMHPIDEMWMETVNKLAHNRLRLTNSDEEIINAIASKL